MTVIKGHMAVLLMVMDPTTRGDELLRQVQAGFRLLE